MDSTSQFLDGQIVVFNIINLQWRTSEGQEINPRFFITPLTNLTWSWKYLGTSDCFFFVLGCLLKSLLRPMQICQKLTVCLVRECESENYLQGLRFRLKVMSPLRSLSLDVSMPKENEHNSVRNIHNYELVPWQLSSTNMYVYACCLINLLPDPLTLKSKIHCICSGIT